MLPTGNTFDNANKNKLIIITSAKICAVITTNTTFVKKLNSRVRKNLGMDYNSWVRSSLRK